MPTTQSLQTTPVPTDQSLQTCTVNSGPSHSTSDQSPESLLLLNFRIPRGLKDQFQTKCRRNRIPMTSELTRMVQDYVIQGSEIQVTSKTQTVQSWMQPITYRDPDTGLLVTADELPLQRR